MASITGRKRGDGSVVYTAQIRIKRDGVVVHSEAKTFNRRSAAKAWAAEREDQIKTDPASATRIDHSRVTVGGLIEAYIKAREAVEPLGRTKGQHLRLLLGFDIASEPATRLTPRRVIAHVQARRAGGTGGATVANDLIWLRVVFRFARTALGIPVDLSALADATEISRAERMISRPMQRKRRPTTDELRRIVDWFKSMRLRPRRNPGPPMDLITWAAIYSCRRISELCGLRLDDYDRDHSSWMVRNIKHPGGSKGNDREMLVTDRFAAVAEAILALPGRAPEEPLLLPFNPKTIGTNWTRAMHVLDIPDLHLHDMRHEGCSRLAEDGLTIPEIQRVSLHESWGSLQTYVQMRARKSERVEWSG